MKQFKTLLGSLPSKTIVFTFGRMNPPSAGHEVLIQHVKKIAHAEKSDYAIYISATQDKKKNPLPQDRKIHYLNLMFPNTHFVAAGGNQRTPIEVAKHLNSTYDHLVLVVGSDRVQTFTKLLNDYNGKEYHYKDIKVMSAGDRDPDADGATGASASKLREYATNNDFSSFRNNLTKSIKEEDAHLLMSEVRSGMGLIDIKEGSGSDSVREQYFKGDIFNVGDFVLVNEEILEVLGRGSNYLSLVDKGGNISKRWLQECYPTDKIIEDVSPGYAPNEITFKGYTTKNFHHVPDAAKSFNDTIDRHGDTEPLSVLTALKHTDTYMGINDSHMGNQEAPTQDDVKNWSTSHTKARESLTRIGEFAHHTDYWLSHGKELDALINKYNYKSQGRELADSYNIEGTMIQEDLSKSIKPDDKARVAKIISDMLGVSASKHTPEDAINASLKVIQTKPLTPALTDVLRKMLVLAKDVGIKFDPNLAPSIKEQADIKIKTSKEDLSPEEYEQLTKLSEPKPMGHTLHNGNETLRRMKIRHITEESDEEFELSDDELDGLADGVKDEDDILDAYSDEELALVDDETGEHIDDIAESVINEVLSRGERIRAKARFARTASKRERKVRIALRTHSSTTTIAKRARHLAVKMLEQKLARKPHDQMSVSEKERVERIVAKKKALIGRMALRLTSRVKNIENTRLAHSKYTQGAK